MILRRDEPESRQLVEAQLRTTLDVIPAYAWYAVPSGALTFVNERTANYLGLPSDHPLRFGIDSGAAWDSHIPFLHPDDHEETRRVWSTCLRTGCAGEVSFRVRNAEGRYRWFLSRVEPLRASDGALRYWVGVNLDIEERKQAEIYLAEGQRLAHMGSWAFNAAGFNYWSAELFRIHGLDPSGKAPTVQEYINLVHPEDRGFVEQTIQRMLAEHHDFDFTKRIVRPDGNIRSVRCVGVPTTHGETSLEFIGTGIDVTEQEQLMEGRRLSEAYLAEAQALSHTGSWVWRLPDREAVHLSDEWYRIYGFDPQLGLPRWEDRLQRVHVEDRNKWQNAIEAAIREKSNYEVEFRILLPDKSLKWVRTVGHPVLSAAGEVVQFVGSSMDITRHKGAEEKLKEQELELRQMLDFAPQMVAVFGPKRERLYANRIAVDYLGVSLDEWRQKSTGFELHPDDSERLNAYADRASIGGFSYKVELRMRKYDGTFRWFLAHYNPVKDASGQIFRWYVACTDIDDRKRAEERLQQENAALREEIDKASMFEEIVGTSVPLKAVLTQITKVAPTDSTVLITGETGTGKELVARAIHRRSTRSFRPFISVNCAAIPRDLVASELFGHEKGAFTGATQRQLGRFELANGGTIFLDEIGELPHDTQIALLRVLQEREVERVGGRQSISIDVRLIAATNRNLVADVTNERFRRDLFYRLNVFPIEMPSLRERKDDILMLVEYFVQRYASRAGKAFPSIAQRTLDLLSSYDWPGNIRELQNVIERSVILSPGGVFSVDESWLSKEAQERPGRITSAVPIKIEAELRSEREIIEAALASSRGRVSGPLGAAYKLRIPPSTLDHRIKALKIDKSRFRFI